MEKIRHKLLKKIISLFLIIAMGTVSVQSLSFNSEYCKAAAYVQKHGRLKVKGTNIADKNGKTVRLKGVSSHGINWDVGYPYITEKTFKTLRDKWKVNTVRLAMYTQDYNGYCVTDVSSRKKLLDTIDTGVKAAKKLGLYVIIDWHVLNDRTPLKYQEKAKKFFAQMSKKYASYQNVLYEICNEPNGNVTWTKDIRPYANRMIKQIRKYDKKNIIIVGTPTWSQDVDVVSEKPLKQKNIMYALHFYAATHKADLRNKLKTAHQNGLPVFVSEFSICDASGNGAIDKKSADQWMKLLNQYKIGYVSWNLSNKAETSSLLKNSCSKTGNFKKSDLSKSGVYIYKYWKKK